MNTERSIENAQRGRICVDGGTTIVTACRLMRSFQVEELVVTDGLTHLLVPVGIVSARDIATRIVAAELDPAVLTAGDIAWLEASGAEAPKALSDRLRSRLAAGCRILPVLDGAGSLAGVVSLDDLLCGLPHSRTSQGGGSINGPRS